jgi:integrase
LARPSKHDGPIYPSKDGKALWMVYRDRNGKRIRESTFTDDWPEAQRKLRERLQARDDRTLDIVRKGEQLQFPDWAAFFLENYSKPPIRAEKTREANQRSARHLKEAFRQRAVGDITADDIELYLRRRLQARVQFKTAEGVIQKDRLKPATVHQELRVLRRMLNVAVRKPLLPANPCSGVEFPVKVTGMFRPHYMSCSEQQRIEFEAPDYLRNIIRIISESGLRVYKELMGMKKEQVDLQNAMVWIPESKTPNGIAEVPLTELALEAFREQIRISEPGAWLFPSGENPTGHQKTLKTVWHAVLRKSKGAIFQDLRSAVDIRDSVKCGWRGRRVGYAIAPAGRCQGVQEVFADEITNEKGGTTETESKGERGRAGF